MPGAGSVTSTVSPTAVARVMGRRALSLSGSASDASNSEAVRLLETLEKRRAKAGKMFDGFVQRAHAEGDTLYTMREQERDVSEAMTEGFKRCYVRSQVKSNQI